MNFFKKSERNYYLKLLSFALGILFLAVGYSVVYLPLLVVLIIIGIILLYCSFFENPFSKVHNNTNLPLRKKEEPMKDVSTDKTVKSTTSKTVRKTPVKNIKQPSKSTKKSVSKKSGKK